MVRLASQLLGLFFGLLVCFWSGVTAMFDECGVCYRATQEGSALFALPSTGEGLAPREGSAPLFAIWPAPVRVEFLLEARHASL